MIAGQPEIRNRIEHLRLSQTGYSRQLAKLEVSPERRERLEVDLRLAEEEIATLEKIAQIGRVEPDRAKVEAAVREQLKAMRARLAADPAFSELSGEERDLTSGEVRALLWALGEDTLTRNMQVLLAGHEQNDPTRTDRAVPTILIHTLEEAPSPEARASAAYELGKLQIAQAIPSLAKALDDDPLVAEVALRALASFSEARLMEANIEERLLADIRRVRND